jgi:small neutral amino acid transporter SnatA (MarC family)
VTVALAVALLVLTVNPPRRYSELPKRPEPVGQGALITLGSLLVLGLAAESILDALEVSLPTFRIAVGGLIAVRSIIDFIRAPLEADDGGGAMIPVFFPVLFRPEFVLAAMLVAVDRRVFVMVFGAAVALSLVVAVVALPRLRFGRPLGVLVSAGALILAIDQMVDGVLAL